MKIIQKRILRNGQRMTVCVIYIVCSPTTYRKKEKKNSKFCVIPISVKLCAICFFVGKEKNRQKTNEWRDLIIPGNKTETQKWRAGGSRFNKGSAAEGI